MKVIGTALLAFLSFAAFGGVETPVRYRATFQSTWSAATHPQDYPSTAHFSPLVGGVHDHRALFWYDGGIATNGIERVAELGSTSVFRGEILAEAAKGHASSSLISGPGISFTPGSATATFSTTTAFPRVTLISMVAPSPDWFVGTTGLELLHNGIWRDDFVFQLPAWDSGTDAGTTFTSSNLDIVPHAPITLIDSPPLGTDGYAPPLGTYTFEILDVDGLPPYDDEDEDGSNNIEEAARGSDPRLDDTDADGIEDPDDNCPATADATGSDADADGHGDVCDVCPALPDPAQRDRDLDGEGDLCDANDGLLQLPAPSTAGWSWSPDDAFETYNLYRGDLQTLRSTGAYTQDPSGAAAEAFCDLDSTSLADPFAPDPDATVFYLLTGVDDQGVQGGLGTAPTGGPRLSGFACP